MDKKKPRWAGLFLRKEYYFFFLAALRFGADFFLAAFFFGAAFLFVAFFAMVSCF
jgi:hypothetical protein